MKSFPMFIKTTGRRVIIVGGGEQAAQKARLMLKTDARTVFAAPELEDEIAGLVEEGRAEQYRGPLTPGFFQGAAMVFVASGCFGVDICAHGLAKEAHCAVNVVDQPALCDMTTPSLVDRDPVVIASGTEGTAPVLARQIKTRMEEELPQSLGGLAALAGRLRGAVSAKVKRSDRRAFWRWVFAEAPMQMWTRGAEVHAAQAIKTAIAAGGAPDRADGGVCVVGVGPGGAEARDLITMRGVQRLQEADVIFYDAMVGEEVLELARRDAERVFTGPFEGAEPWPALAARMLSEARKGARVVQLQAGEVSTRGLPDAEIVPGVALTAAPAGPLKKALP